MASDSAVDNGGGGERGERGSKAGCISECVDFLRPGGDLAVTVGEEARWEMHEGERTVGGELEKWRGLPHGIVKRELQAPISVTGAARSKWTVDSCALRW